jgi:hypothetical protein
VSYGGARRTTKPEKVTCPQCKELLKDRNKLAELKKIANYLEMITKKKS